MASIQNFIEVVFNNNYFLACGVFITAFFISWFSIPRVLAVAREKNLYDKPNGRTSHKVNTPTLGGVAIFASTLIPIFIFINGATHPSFQYMVASLIILFFIGIKDDILTISPWKKLVGQIVAALILIILGDIRFTSLNGFLGIYEIPFTLSLFISLFVYIVIINCINLVDGVDGLASGLSILTSIVFTIWFYVNHMSNCMIISLSLVGALIPFFIYNVFGKKNKLFMGDTGALIIGLISVILVIRFNDLSSININQSPFTITAVPAMSIALFFIPLFDTLQVFAIRIRYRKSPFNPDKNHLHHLLLNLGLTHIQTSLFLISLNALVIISSYFLQFLGTLYLSILLFLTGFCFLIILKYLNKHRIS